MAQTMWRNCLMVIGGLAIVRCLGAEAADARCRGQEPQPLGEELVKSIAPPDSLGAVCAAFEKRRGRLVELFEKINKKKINRSYRKYCCLPKKPDDDRFPIVTDLAKFFRELAWSAAKQEYVFSRPDGDSVVDADDVQALNAAFNNTLGDLKQMLVFVYHKDAAPIPLAASDSRPAICNKDQILKYGACVLENMKGFVKRVCRLRKYRGSGKSRGSKGRRKSTTGSKRQRGRKHRKGGKRTERKE